MNQEIRYMNYVILNWSKSLEMNLFCIKEWYFIFSSLSSVQYSEKFAFIPIFAVERVHFKINGFQKQKHHSKSFEWIQTNSFLCDTFPWIKYLSYDHDFNYGLMLVLKS